MKNKNDKRVGNVARNGGTQTARIAFLGLALAGLAWAPAQAENGYPEFSVSGHAAFRAGLTSSLVDRWDGGPARVRFGAEKPDTSQGFATLAEAAVEIQAQFNSSVGALVHAQYQPEDDRAVGLVTGYLHAARDLTSRTRLSLRGGAFFPGISKSNRGLGWSNGYTLSNGPTMTWIAEDVRPIGVAAGVAWSGDRMSLGGEVTGFFSNDGVGAALALGGWALNDVKVPVSGRQEFFNPGDPGSGSVRVDGFRESDGRAGVSLRLDAQIYSIGALSALYWDNRADPTQAASTQANSTQTNSTQANSSEPVWDTRFWVLAGEFFLPGGVALLPHASIGTTDNGVTGTDFFSASLLLGRDFGPVRAGLRGDYFHQDDIRSEFLPAGPPPALPVLDERGGAVTAALFYHLGDHHRIGGEIIHVRSSREAAAFGGTEDGRNLNETLIQAEYRVSF